MNEQRGTGFSDIDKRRETMEDGRRYIIYYTFGDTPADNKEDVKEKSENV